MRRILAIATTVKNGLNAARKLMECKGASCAEIERYKKANGTYVCKLANGQIVHVQVRSSAGLKSYAMWED